MTEDPKEKDTFATAFESLLQTYFDMHPENLSPSGLHRYIIREVETILIQKCLDVTNGNQLKTAEILGVNRNTLRSKMKALDICATVHKK